MNTRPAWGILALGALIVIALFLSPIWLQSFSDYFEPKSPKRQFPEEFDALPNEDQDLYEKLYAVDAAMAQDFVTARLQEPVVVDDLAPATVQLLLTGPFVRIDAIHRASGTASIYRLADGTNVLRLEDLDALNAPDVRVLLSAHPNPITPEDLSRQALQYSIKLGALKGNQGHQNYTIDEHTFNADNYDGGSVVLYSARYETIMSFASLSRPPEE